MTNQHSVFVAWITGLSAAGKTTIGKEVFRKVRERIPNSVFLDGDLFREIMGDDLGHDPEARVQNAFRLSRMCRFLSAQDISVVCCTMSLYPEIWAWNRENIPGYREIYLKVDQAVLVERDPKGLYARAKAGEESNIVGFDIPFNEPSSPDLIIENSRSEEGDVAERAQEIFEFLISRSAT